jgi:hypothetical protein
MGSYQFIQIMVKCYLLSIICKNERSTLLVIGDKLRSRLNSLSPSVPELSILIGAPYLYFVTYGYFFIQYFELKIINTEAVMLKVTGNIWS